MSVVLRSHLGGVMKNDWMDLALTVDNDFLTHSNLGRVVGLEAKKVVDVAGQVWNQNQSRAKADGRTSKWRIARRGPSP